MPPAETLTPAQLRDAVKEGPDQVKEVIQGPKPHERAELRRRVELAIKIVTEELKDLKEEERKIVIEMSRQIVQETLDTVTAEIQSAAKEKMQALQVEQRELFSVRETVLGQERELATPEELAKIEARELYYDVRAAGWKERLGYGAAALAGAIGLTWLWDKIDWMWGKVVGTKEEPGFIRKTLRFLVTITGAAAGAVWLSKFFRGNVGRITRTLAEKTEKGTREGLAPTMRTVERLQDVGSNTAEVLKNKDQYSTTAEYCKDLVVALAKDGAHLVWEGPVLHIWDSTKTILLDVSPDWAGHMIDFVSDPSVESFGEVWAVYVEGTVVYGTSFGAIEGLLKARKAGVIAGVREAAGRAATWPVQVFKKTGGGLAWDVAHGSISSGPGGKLAWARAQGTLRVPRYHLNRLIHKVKPSTAAHLDSLVHEWATWKQMATAARRDPKLAKVFLERTQDIADQVKDTLIALQKKAGAGKTLTLPGRSLAIVPELPGQLQAAVREADSALLTDDLLYDWLKKTSPEVAEAAARAEAVAAAEAARPARAAAETLSKVQGLAKHKPTQYLLRHAEKAEEYTRILSRVHAEEGVKGVKRVSNYLMKLDEGAHTISQSDDILKLVAQGKGPAGAGMSASRWARMMNRVPLESALRPAQFIDDYVRLHKAGVGTRILGGVGVVIEGAFLAHDIRRYAEAMERAHTARMQLDTQLWNMKDDKGERIFERTETDGKVTFEGYGIKINMEELSLDETDVEAQLGRIGLDTAGLAMAGTFLLAPSATFGPAGLLVAGVIVTAHIALDEVRSSVRQWRERKLVDHLPPWILSEIGAVALRRHEYEIIRENIGHMRSDILPHDWWDLFEVPVRAGLYVVGVEMNVKMKEAVREKMLQSLLYRFYKGLRPDVRAEFEQHWLDMVPMEMRGEMPLLFDPEGPFKEYYDKIIRPYIILRLHAETREVPFTATEKLDLRAEEQRGSFSTIPVVRKHVFEQAVWESLHLCLMHIRELKHRQTLQQIEEQAGGNENYRQALLAVYGEDIEENKWHYYIFNEHPDRIPEVAGMTFAEHMVQERLAEVRRIGDARGNAAEAAQKGYLSPVVYSPERFPPERYSQESIEQYRQGRSPQNISQYAQSHLRLQHNLWVKKELEERDKERFEQLEAMGDDEEFIEKFVEQMAPHRCINELYDQFHRGEIKTDVELSERLGSVSGDIDDYLEFQQHRDFYVDYVSFWRDMSPAMVSEDHSEFITLLKNWLERKQQLIDEERFRALRQEVARRRQEKQRERQRLVVDPSLLPGFQEQLSLGMDVTMEHPILFDLGTYQRFMQEWNRSARLAGARPGVAPEVLRTREQVQIPFAIRPQLPPEPQLQRMPGFDRPLHPIVNMLNALGLRYFPFAIGAKQIIDTRTKARGTYTENLILSPEELGAGALKRFLKNDGFDELRTLMLGGRVSIVVDAAQLDPTKVQLLPKPYGEIPTIQREGSIRVPIDFGPKPAS